MSANINIVKIDNGTGAIMLSYCYGWYCCIVDKVAGDVRIFLYLKNECLILSEILKWENMDFMFGISSLYFLDLYYIYFWVFLNNFIPVL